MFAGDCSKTTVSGPRSNSRLPGADRLLDRGQCATHEDRGGDHDAGRGLVAKYEIGPEAQYGHLQGQSVTPRDCRDEAATVGGENLSMVCLVLLRLPPLQQRFQHAHRLHDLCIANSRLGLHICARLGALGLSQWLACEVFVEQCQREQDDPAAQRQPPEPRVHEEYGPEKQRRPRRVKDREDARACEEIPDLIQVAQWTGIDLTGR
ncbi:hypothetical protein D9M70_475250 [compost metagenome]